MQAQLGQWLVGYVATVMILSILSLDYWRCACQNCSNAADKGRIAVRGDFLRHMKKFTAVAIAGIMYTSLTLDSLLYSQIKKNFLELCRKIT
jgi:hypothetical protein